MKLDYDCVRDLLLALEEQPYFDDSLGYLYVRLHVLKDSPLLAGHNLANICYAAIILEEAGYIECSFIESDDALHDILFSRLTYEGHEYLGRVRSPEIWKHVKLVLGKLGTVSLNIVSSVAISVISNMLSR